MELTTDVTAAQWATMSAENKATLRSIWLEKELEANGFELWVLFLAPQDHPIWPAYRKAMAGIIIRSLTLEKSVADAEGAAL